MGFHGSGISHVDSLFRSREYRERSAKRNGGQIQLAMGTFKRYDFGTVDAEIGCEIRFISWWDSHEIVLIMIVSISRCGNGIAFSRDVL